MAAHYGGKPIKGVILDISGVLKNCNDGADTPIPGSVDAVNKLRNSGLQLRFCTNETSVTRHRLVTELRSLGFTLYEEHVFPPIPAMCKILSERNLRPHILVHPDALSDFDSIDCSNPNCVIVGDAEEAFNYDNLTKAFQCLMKMEKPVLFSLGKGRYYRKGEDLVLDVGPFKAALEYASGAESEIVGKPSPSFYGSVLSDMGVSPSEAVMVGDDIVSDVGGSQACGMTGVLVRTGKFTTPDENHPSVKPDAIVDNLAQFVNDLFSDKK